MRPLVFVGVLAILSLQARAQEHRTGIGMQVAWATERGDTLGSGPSSHTQMVMVQPELLIGLAQTNGNAKFQIVNEVTLAESLRPMRRFILAVSDGFRYNAMPGRRIGGYAELGAGIGSSALHVAEYAANPDFRQLDGWLQYHLQVGAGARIHLDHGLIRIGYRWTHFSNHETTRPNLGLNLHTVVVAYEHPF